MKIYTKDNIKVDKEDMKFSNNWRFDIIYNNKTECSGSINLDEDDCIPIEFTFSDGKEYSYSIDIEEYYDPNIVIGQDETRQNEIYPEDRLETVIANYANKAYNESIS